MDLERGEPMVSFPVRKNGFRKTQKFLRQPMPPKADRFPMILAGDGGQEKILESRPQLPPKKYLGIIHDRT